MGEIHELFVLALSLVWFAGATSEAGGQGRKFSPLDEVLTMMHMLDANVGRIKDALVSKGMWDNTLIVFSSDNGGGLGGGP